jgi:hypothetical protein
LEDALKRLDKLTHEEARMAIAQVLKATHSVRDDLRVVDDRVRVVDNKVAEVIDGTQAIFTQSRKNIYIEP